MQLLRYIGEKVSKQAYRMNVGSSVRHHYELDVDSATYCFGVDFGDTEAIHLSRLLAGNRTLQTMRLRIQPTLTVRGAEALAKAIVKSSIRKLHLFGTVGSLPRQGDVGAAQQRPHPRINLGPNRFAEGHLIWEFANPDAVQALLFGIRESDTIQELIISHDTSFPPGALSKTNIQDVALTMQNSHSIKRLDLNFNLMSDEDICILLQHWRRDSSTEELSLKLNRIGPKGAMQLVQAITMPSSLQKLDLSFNFDIGFDGIQRIAEELLPHAQLRELRLRGCIHHWEFTESGDFLSSNSNDQAPILDAREKAETALVEAIRRNVYLQTLDVRNNHFSDQTMTEIAFYCGLNQSGRHLLALEDENSGLPQAIWGDVLAKCHNEPSYIYFFLREQPTLGRQAAVAPSSVTTTLGKSIGRKPVSVSTGFTIEAARSILKRINKSPPLYRKSLSKFI